VASHGSAWSTDVLQTNTIGCEGLIDGLNRIPVFLLHPLPMYRVGELRVLRHIDLDVRHAFLYQFQKFITNDMGEIMRKGGPCGVNFVRHPWRVRIHSKDHLAWHGDFVWILACALRKDYSRRDTRRTRRSFAATTGCVVCVILGPSRPIVVLITGCCTKPSMEVPKIHPSSRLGGTRRR